MNNSKNSQNSSNVFDQIDMVAGSPGGLSGASDDNDDNYPSSSGLVYEESANLMTTAMGDEVTAQLAAAGPVGVAAAAAIVSAKNQKIPYSFETNPSKRRRQQNRLLKKLKETIDEFTARIGQQAIVLVASPGKPNTSYKVFGAKPLENVIKNLRPVIMEDLDNALAHQAPPPVPDDPTLFELPPLTIDGIPTPIQKMTQAQLRAFIPLMLKYSTGLGKPGWGQESTRPPWWPKELPWANIRMDQRSIDEKQQIPWTHALRQIVISCYKHHCREDLLLAFTEEDERANAAVTANANVSSLVDVLKMHSSGTVPTHIIQFQANGSSQIIAVSLDSISGSWAQVCLDPAGYNSDIDIITQYTGTAVLNTLTNLDETISTVQVGPNCPIITLPDGITAHIQGMATIQTTQGEDGTTVHTITITEGGAQDEGVYLSSELAATLDSEGQIILTGEDGLGSGVTTAPVSASMPKTNVANIQHLHVNSDGTCCSST